MKSPFGYLGTHGFFLLFCAGIIVIVFFSLSSLQLAADGDAMLGMFRLKFHLINSKFHLINSAPLHGSHVVCELLSTNCLPDNCACVFDFELQLICCGKEFGVCRFSLWPLLVPLALLFPMRPKHLWTASVCILYLLGLDSNSGEKRNGDSWCVYFWLMLGSIWSWRFMFISISKSAGAYRHSAPLYQRTMAWISDVHKLTGTDCAARSLFCGICCRLLLVLISYPAARLVSLSVPRPWPGSPHHASHCRGRGGREECIPRLKTAKREPGDRAMVISSRQLVRRGAPSRGARWRERYGRAEHLLFLSPCYLMKWWS